MAAACGDVRGPSAFGVATASIPCDPLSASGGTPGGRSKPSAALSAAPADWRNAILVEHHGPDLSGVDPDFQQPANGNPRTYEAMRTQRFLYVEYNDGEREFYDLRQDPFELHNLAGRLSLTDRVLLHTELLAMEQCHGGLACWNAMHLDSTTVAFQRHRVARRHP